MQISSERLLLRHWREDDLSSLTQLNADVEVNRWLGGTALAQRSAESLKTMRSQMEANRWGVLAVCDKAGDLLGLAGFQSVRPAVPVAPAVEAVWRLRRSAWGRGYAREAMTTLLALGPSLGLPSEIVALIAKPNVRSAATATSLGFVPAPARDFDHPLLVLGDPLRPHATFTWTTPAAAGG